MKAIITLLFTAFSLFLFSQDINKTDAKGKKQGEWKKLYDNSFVRYQGQFKDDKPFGIFNYYYESGKPSIVMNYDDPISRTIAFYDEEGTPKAKGNYLNQKKDSIWNYYSSAGYKISEELYVNGLKQGKVINYFADGKIAEEKEFENNFENGEWNQYYENEKIRMKSTYKNGSLEGKSYYYGRDGKKIIEGNFLHDVRHGAWMFFDEKGTITKKEIYHNGQREGRNDNIIDESKDLKEKQDVLDFEDMIAPR